MVDGGFVAIENWERRIWLNSVHALNPELIKKSQPHIWQRNPIRLVQTVHEVSHKMVNRNLVSPSAAMPRFNNNYASSRCPETGHVMNDIGRLSKI